jgi:hypothetical protein
MKRLWLYLISTIVIILILSTIFIGFGKKKCSVDSDCKLLTSCCGKVKGSYNSIYVNFKNWLSNKESICGASSCVEYLFVKEAYCNEDKKCDIITNCEATCKKYNQRLAKINMSLNSLDTLKIIFTKEIKEETSCNCDFMIEIN